MRVFMGVFFLHLGIFKAFGLPGFHVLHWVMTSLPESCPLCLYLPIFGTSLALGYFLECPLCKLCYGYFNGYRSIGVLRELLRGSKDKCACLGTYVKLPLRPLVLIEDLAWRYGIIALYFQVF